MNNDNPVRSHPFSSIVAVARRRHALRHIGMEVFFKDEGQVVRNISSGTFTGGASVFYTFQSVEKRDAAVSTLLEQLGVSVISPVHFALKLTTISFRRT